MIQRRQTLWLAQAAVFTGLTFKLPFKSGDWTGDDLPNTVVDLDATLSIPIMIVAILTGLLALGTVYLFRNRKLQLRFSIGGILLSLLLLGLFFWESTRFLTGTIALWALIPVAVVISFALATRGIQADEKLIKSMDRLR